MTPTLAFALLLAFFGHWLADFYFQGREMAEKKSKSWYWLLLHSSIYAYVVAIIMTLGPLFITANFRYLFCTLFLTHIVIDKISSQFTAKYHASGETHKFFTVIGFDQFCHMGVLTYLFLILL